MLKKLDNINSKQSKICNQNCRYSVCTIIATCWVSLFPKGPASQYTEDAATIPFIVLILAVTYFVIDTICYYSVARLARQLHKKVKEMEIDPDCAEHIMTIKSDKTFVLLKFKIIYCIMLAVLLGYYIVTLFI